MRIRSENAALPDDWSFGAAPFVPATFSFTAPNRPIARIVDQAAAERDRGWDGLKLSAGTQNESGALGSAMRPGRTFARRNSRSSMAGLTRSSRGAA